jgi:hypothetical protein
LNDTGQPYLLRIVRYNWAYAIDPSPEMAIRTLYDFGDSHARPERLEM